VDFDVWGGSAGAGAEVDVCVVCDVGGEGAGEGVRDELGRGTRLQEGDVEGPAEGEAGLDFGAEVLGKPELIIDLEQMKAWE